jgi:hypothetical protein
MFFPIFPSELPDRFYHYSYIFNYDPSQEVKQPQKLIQCRWCCYESVNEMRQFS